MTTDRDLRELTDGVVAVAGDFHGDERWAHAALHEIRRASTTVRTVFHLGDLWPAGAMLNRINSTCEDLDLRVLLTCGNHEPFDLFRRLWTDPTRPLWLGGHVAVLPRPWRMTVGGRRVLSLGGAASVDREWRVLGREWWPDEAITDQMVEAAIAGGPADLMLTHETPDATPVQVVQRILAVNPLGFPAQARRESEASRLQVQKVWDATRPKLLVHGHMHAAGDGTTDDGRRVLSLGCNGQRGNVRIVHLRTWRTTLVV